MAHGDIHRHSWQSYQSFSRLWRSMLAFARQIAWEGTNAINIHLIKWGFVEGYTTWSHHGEAISTFNIEDIDTRYDEEGGEDADENDHVMMDDTSDCGDQNGVYLINFLINGIACIIIFIY